MTDNKEKFFLFRIRVFKDEQAFASILGIYSAGLQKFLYRKLPTQADVEDAYSTLMFRLWEYAIQTPVQHFSGLAYTIARGIIAEFYKQREGKDLVVVNEEGEKGVHLESQFSGEQIQKNVDVQLVTQGINALENEDDREALLLRFVEGYSVKEIAKYLGKTENATSVLIHRALKKVRTFFEKK
ncbi:sigma-70 family RNA polymerase sigma factor [Candidatus Uhrbacteria bacterium]|nr:sigma-70 family RNA polymerase sigma factor [Candidatus Uhrbacteria bacterium]